MSCKSQSLVRISGQYVAPDYHHHLHSLFKYRSQLVTCHNQIQNEIWQQELRIQLFEMIMEMWSQMVIE